MPSNSSCQNSIGHEDCGFNPPIVEREGHRADRNAFERSSNKVYRRKIEKQKKVKFGK